MTTQQIKDYILSKKGAYEDYPFGPDTLVYRVGSKMFVLTNPLEHSTLTLKCEPSNGIFLREQHPEIVPGYHMNKKHWITVDTTGQLTDVTLMNLIDESYNLVVKSLPKKERDQI